MYAPRLAVLCVLLGACAPAVSSELAAPTPEQSREPLAVEEQGPEPVSAVAFVNGVPVTTQAFDAIYELKLQKYADRGHEVPETADRRYKRSITDRLIYHEVLRQETERRGLSYDEAVLAAREVQQREGIEDWDGHLRRRGESNESLRELYIAEQRERALLDALGMLTVSEAELRQEYEAARDNYDTSKERVRAAHILIRVGPDPMPDAPTAAQQQQWEAEARQKIDALYAEATAPGADFAQLARERSEGPDADDGGDLGIFSEERMVASFSSAAFALKPGEVSKPVRTKFGFHIIKVRDKYPPGQLPFEALEDQLRERLSARKLHQGRRDLKATLLEAYAIDNLMDEQLGPDPRALRREEQRREAAIPPP